MANGRCLSSQTRWSRLLTTVLSVARCLAVRAAVVSLAHFPCVLLSVNDGVAVARRLCIQERGGRWP